MRNTTPLPVAYRRHYPSCLTPLCRLLTGVAGGLYAFNQPLKQYSEDQKTHDSVRRSSDNQPQPGAAKGGASPVPPLHTGGSTATSASAPTIAGASAESRRSGSVDHEAPMRSKSDAKQQDGSQGGGMGVKEMRERKMAGQGLPSPQVSGTDSGHGTGNRAFPSGHQSERVDRSDSGELTPLLSLCFFDIRAAIPKPKSSPPNRDTRTPSDLPSLSLPLTHLHRARV